MEKIFIQVLLVVTVSRVFGKYVYKREEKTWTDAQRYCRQHYTELAPVSGPEDDLKLKDIAGGSFPLRFHWIGLYREPNDFTGWKWSEGGSATYLNFSLGNPTNEPSQNFVSLGDSGWYNTLNYPGYFFCLSLFVVREPKTWEEALEYCREQYTDLTSLLSETEMLLAHREIQEQAQTALVWTGLRFLGDHWLWVNGDPLNYQVWPPGGGHQCPARNLRCGAVGTAGHWEAHDCQERLSFICY